MENKYFANRLADQFRLVTTERVQTMFGLFDRDIFATQGNSMEVFRGRYYLCSLRVSETGMGTDVKPAMIQTKLRNGDEIYYVDLGPRILHLSGQLITRDSYNPNYNAEITIRVNNPLVFLQCYFQGMKDARLDPITRFKTAVERALRRYAESKEHDRIKGRDLESAAFKNHEGRNVGVWIERSFANIIQDPQRQKIREIEKQTEVEKAIERSRSEIQNVKFRNTLTEETKQREHSRREKSKDTTFELNEDAKKQLFVYQQKMREIVINTVHPQWTDYILKELEKVDNSIPEFFSKNPQFLQYYPGLSQLLSLQKPRLTLKDPNSDMRRQNVSDTRLGSVQRGPGDVSR